MLELSSFSFDGGRAGLLESVGDPPAGKVVGRELHEDAVTRKKLYVLDSDVRTDVGEHLVTVIELYFEHIVRQRLSHFPFHLYCFLLGHAPSLRRDGTTGA